MYNGNMIISMSVTRPEALLKRAGVVMEEFPSEVLIRVGWEGIKQFLWQAARRREGLPGMSLAMVRVAARRITTNLQSFFLPYFLSVRTPLRK
jgi:hypothetical protein